MKNATIGIRREDKNRWETRAPLTPAQVGALRQEHGLEFEVQPSDLRVFPAGEYARAGARVTDDLSGCGVVLGVKEMPLPFFQPGRTYAFFAHVIKGQKYNMPMLARMMELGCSLVDYEKVVDEAGRRLVFFGRYAGLAGMIDTLHGLGRRLALEGLETPFDRVLPALKYGSVERARAALSEVGAAVRARGLPGQLLPLVFGVSGYGNVARGVFEILDTLGAVEASPDDLRRLSPDPRRLYRVTFKEEHTVEPREAGRQFDLEEYYRQPELYRPRFERYLPHLTALANCVYWNRRYPRLVTREWLRTEWPANPRLRIIGDISCDIEGSIEVTVKSTDPGNPFYAYEPGTGAVRDGLEGPGVAILAVDNLPCELPVDATEEFGRALGPFVPALAGADFSRELGQVELPAPLRRALILHRGRLTPGYGYISGFLSGKE